MKISALLLKDAYELRRQFGMFYLVILLFAVIPFGYLNAFALSYTVFFPMTAIATDERSGWNRLAPMLPYSPRERVSHLFVLSWVCGLLILAASAALRIIALPLHLKLVSFFLLLTTYFLVQIWSAIMIPLIIRFGPTKSRLIRMVFIGLACGTATAVGTGDSVGSPMAGLPVILLMMVIAVAATAVSLPISARLMAQSES